MKCTLCGKEAVKTYCVKDDAPAFRNVCRRCALMKGTIKDFDYGTIIEKDGNIYMVAHLLGSPEKVAVVLSYKHGYGAAFAGLSGNIYTDFTDEVFTLYEKRVSMYNSPFGLRVQYGIEDDEE